jgi:hypothetical protein
MGKWRCSLRHFYFGTGRRSGQLHVFVALPPEKERLVHRDFYNVVLRFHLIFCLYNHYIFVIIIKQGSLLNHNLDAVLFIWSWSNCDQRNIFCFLSSGTWYVYVMSIFHTRSFWLYWGRPISFISPDSSLKEIYYYYYYYKFSHCGFVCVCLFLYLHSCSLCN